MRGRSHPWLLTLLTCEVGGGPWFGQVVLRGHLSPPSWLTAQLGGVQETSEPAPPQLQTPPQALPWTMGLSS